LIELFDPQRDGYRSQHKEMLLIGSPGCGKTHSILESFVLPALVDHRPSKILACTFARDAARELRDRISAAAQIKTQDLLRTGSTIHSEAKWISEKTYGPTKLHKEVAPDEDEWRGGLGHQRGTLREDAIRLWDLGRQVCVIDSLPKTEADVMRVLYRGLDRSGSKHRVDDLALEILAYEAAKAADGTVDFTDLLLHALWSGHVVDRAVLVVDEAQDLTPLQIALVRLWAQGAEQLAWIGDPDQGIYNFNGADGTHLTRMIESGLTTRSLQQSYRVPREVHAVARRIILRNRDRVDAPYLPSRMPGEVYEAASLSEGIGYVEDASERGSVFLLSSMGRRLRLFAAELDQRGVPFRYRAAKYDKSSPWGNTSARYAILALCDILVGHLVGKDQLRALIEKIRVHSDAGDFFTGTKTDAKAACSALEPGEFLHAENIGRVGLDYSEIASCASLEAALARMGEMDRSAPQMRIYERLGEPGLRREPPLVLATFHGCKGLEADSVMVDLEGSHYAQSAVKRGDTREIEGYRRTLYVACTRARASLCLSHAPNDLGRLLAIQLF
jgi:superfamily I DNA/RNA helicase